MDCLSRHDCIREALQEDLSVTQRGADDIVSRLDDCSLVLALDVAAIRAAQGSSEPGDDSCRPVAELDQWDERIAAVQDRLQVAREAIARLKSENLRLRKELTWQLP
jgi:hypothetical protein